MTSTPQRDSLGSARRPSQGFTLIEVMVALMIVALIATIGVKGFRTVTKSSLREGSSHMAGAIRFLFDRASITGKYHRLVIDLNEGRYWAEVSDDRFYAPNQAESEPERRKREEKEDAVEEEERKRKEKQQLLYGSNSSSSSSASSSSSFDMSKMEVGEFRPRRARFAAFKETALKPVTLKKEVRIKSVYTPRMTDPVTAGRVYLYFYPLGQTEPAVITMTDKSGANVFSLVVHPITGRVRIYNEEVKPNLGVRYDDDGNQVVQ
ncbi:MAG TPA: prepilin-type N-terminal cleavage/methylation domain-containing protein [Polyangia bacterium]|nr:prepilin-type N-terminal cleavage/methylation domain-containing protein [Polyangia bacterium]